MINKFKNYTNESLKISDIGKYISRYDRNPFDYLKDMNDTVMDELIDDFNNCDNINCVNEIIIELTNFLYDNDYDTELVDMIYDDLIAYLEGDFENEKTYEIIGLPSGQIIEDLSEYQIDYLKKLGLIYIIKKYSPDKDTPKMELNAHCFEDSNYYEIQKLLNDM